MAENQKIVAVVIVPFPMQGHLTPLLRLSRRIAAYGIPVHYVGSTTANRQAAVRFDGWNPYATDNFHFYSFPAPPFENLPPNPNSRVHTHLWKMISATLSGFEKPLSSLVKNLSSNYTRVVIIFDALMASTAKSVHSISLPIPNVESYVFETSSAFTIYSAYWEKFGKPALPPEEAAAMRGIPSLADCFTPEFREFVYSQYDVRDFHSGTIFNSCRLVEGSYLDLLANLPQFGKNIWAIGPLNPVHELERTNSVGRVSKRLNWICNQPSRSVLLVSFGMAISLSDVQIEELALGLEASRVRFVWLLRDADRGDIFADGVRRIELPQGFEESVRNRGIVVRQWESQHEILRFEAIGGFLTNCGWNSCMESITAGVPIVAWPMHSDQARNAVLMTKVLKIGVEVRDWLYRDELVCSSKIESAIRRLFTADREGFRMGMRITVRLLGAMVESPWAQDNPTMVEEMDSFIIHIARA